MDRSIVGALGDTFQQMKPGLGRLVTSKILGKRESMLLDFESQFNWELREAGKCSVHSEISSESVAKILGRHLGRGSHHGIRVGKYRFCSWTFMLRL